MKVLHLISGGDSGGARTHVHLLLKHLNLNTEGTEASMVCFMDGPFARDAMAMGIPVTVLRKNPLLSLGRLKKMIRANGYDLIHCHGARGNLMGALLRRQLNVSVITTVHSDPRLDYMGRPWARLTYGTLNALALRRMDYYVGVSDAMRALLISRGFDPCRMFTVYNGVEFAAEETPPAPFDKAAYLAALGLDAPAEAVVVGIAARLHPVKDLPTLLRGFQAAYAAQPRLRLLIAGEGQDRARLETLAGELGIRDVTCFAGWVQDMDHFYRAIDINVLTSLSETFPYAITEGARAHLPTVSTAVGGIPALLRDGETGYLIQPGDHAALGRHLAALAASPEERRRLGQALYEKAKAEFSAQATARRQREIYDSVCRRYGRMQAKGRDGVLICGAYGMSNAGDEAILGAVVAEMRGIDPEMPISVMTRRRLETAQRYGVDAIHTFNLPAFLRCMKRRELYINGGGSLLQDVTSSRSLWYYLFTLRAAKRRGCKVMMYGCGVGPVSRKGNRRLAGRIVDRCVDAVTLREENSLAELKSFGVTRPSIAVSSDPALFLTPAPAAEVDEMLRRHGLEPDERCLCLCLRRWPGVRDRLDLFAAAADYAWENYGLRPVLLSVNPRQDDRTAELARERIQAPCVLVQESMDANLMVGFVGRMQAVLAMRLHVLIFAASQSVPLAAVSYDPKVASFLDYLQQDNYVKFEELTTREQLYALVDTVAKADRAALQQATARIMAIEGRNAATARRLLEREGEA